MYHRVSSNVYRNSFPNCTQKEKSKSYSAYSYSGMERNLRDYTLCGFYTTRVSHPVTLVTFCVFLIRSILEYCCQVWGTIISSYLSDNRRALCILYPYPVLLSYSSAPETFFFSVPLKLTQSVYLSRLSAQCHISVRLKNFRNCGSVFAVASFTATDKLCISVGRLL